MPLRESGTNESGYTVLLSHLSGDVRPTVELSGLNCTVTEHYLQSGVRFVTFVKRCFPSSSWSGQPYELETPGAETGFSSTVETLKVFYLQEQKQINKSKFM